MGTALENFLCDTRVVVRVVDSPVTIGTGDMAMFGETYDRHPPSLDAFKYYAWLEIAQLCAKFDGNPIDVRVVVADVATTRNAPGDSKGALLALGARRAEWLRTAFMCLGWSITVCLMSDFLDTPDFQARLTAAEAAVRESSDAYASIVQTVPERFRAEEEAKGWRYALEEVATILPYRLKVGPPRELFYDDPARIVSRQMGGAAMSSVILHPTYPLGLPLSSLLRDSELEEFGVTPYKCGSRGLSNHRIKLGMEGTKEARDLLLATPVGRVGLPQPLREVATVCGLVNSAASGSLAVEEFPLGQSRESRDEVMDYVLTTLDFLEMTLPTWGG